MKLTFNRKDYPQCTECRVKGVPTTIIKIGDISLTTVVSFELCAICELELIAKLATSIQKELQNG